jgi:hypothetical protein
MSTEKSSDLIGNGTHELSAYSLNQLRYRVPQLKDNPL